MGKDRYDALVRLAVLILLGAVIVGISPEEAVLGFVLKIVFAHVAVSYAALALFALAALFGIAHLLTGRDAFGDWAAGAMRAAFLFWIAYIAMSMLVAKLAWGGVNWSEPRLIIAFRNAAIAFVAALAAFLAANPRAVSATSVVLGAAIFELWSTRSDQLHPGNPIWSSDSLSIKAFAVAIMIVALLAAVEAAHALRPGLGRREDRLAEEAPRQGTA